jgi:hypothetical protein
MTSRFPVPWRIVEMPNGFAVDDATGRQLAVFYGRADPNIAGHTGYLTINEARQLALNFVKLPELLKLASTASPFAKTTLQQPCVRAPQAESETHPNAAKPPPNDVDLALDGHDASSAPHAVGIPIECIGNTIDDPSGSQLR